MRIELSLCNPIQDDLFEVTHEGQGLDGPKELVLPGGGAKYEMAYSPLVVGSYEGSVTFVNDTVGEPLVQAPAAVPAPGAHRSGRVPVRARAQGQEDGDDPQPLA